MYLVFATIPKHPLLPTKWLYKTLCEYIQLYMANVLKQSYF